MPKSTQSPLKIIIILLLLLLGGLFVLVKFWPQAKDQANTSDSSQIKAVVSILPQKQIVDLIGGDKVDTKVLIPAGYSPATFEPTTQEVKAISQADVYFRIGYIGFEKTNLDKIRGLNDELFIVDTSQNNDLRIMTEEHDHGYEEAEHQDEAEIDPHVWLVPSMVAQQAEIIADQLSEIDPENQDYYQQNFEELNQELSQLDQELEASLVPISGKTMLVYHPAFGYLADAYGFHQEHIEIEGQDPSIQELQKIITQARSENIQVVFVQEQFSTNSAKAIAEDIGGVVVQVNPLAPDYLNNIKQIAETLAAKL